MFTRRTLLQNAIKVSAGVALAPATRYCSASSQLVSLRLAKAAPVPVAADFMGLGYEMSSVAPLGLLSVTNKNYLALIKGLSQQGVLRVGGIVADYTHYRPKGSILAKPEDTVITRASLEQFAAFLKELSWTAIWSLNFAHGSLDDAITEARAVSNALGPQLLALELGNEVENYSHGNRPIRKAPYAFEDFRTEWRSWHDAILKAVPGVRFAAPDTAGSVEWVERMAQDARGDVQLLTTHYYRENQKRGSAQLLSTPDPRLLNVLERLRTASQQSGIPWRMCETNSFSGGGLPGVSDTFLGALWTLDFMLLLASYGCSGVNIETGVNQLGFISCYSPIADDGAGRNTAGVPYYGMLAFAEASRGCSEMFPLDLGLQEPNLTSYALGASGRPLSLVVVNRDRTRDALISVADLDLGGVTIQRLLAPTPESMTSVTFGDATVDAEGRWKAKQLETIHNVRITVPRMSAIVLRRADAHP